MGPGQCEAQRAIHAQLSQRLGVCAAPASAALARFTLVLIWWGASILHHPIAEGLQLLGQLHGELAQLDKELWQPLLNELFAFCWLVARQCSQAC